MKKRQQIKSLQGAACPTGMVSQGQKLQINLFVLAAASSCSTLLVRKENVQDEGRQMIISLQKSLLGVAYGRSNLERVRIVLCRKHHWKGKEIQTKGINTEQELCQGAKNFPWQAKELMASSCFLDRKERCQNLQQEKSLTEHSYQNIADNRDHLKILYSSWLQKNKFCYQKILYSCYNLHYWHSAAFIF